MPYLKDGGSVRRTLLDPQEANQSESSYDLSIGEIGTWIKTNWIYLAGAIAFVVLAWILYRNKEKFTTESNYF